MRKVCSNCRQEKPVEEFYGVKRSQCKECERDSARIRMATPENRMKSALRTSQRAAKKYDAEDTLTLDELKYIFAAADGKCSYCGKRDPDDVQVDHIRPLSRGGTNTADNITTACGKCNRDKRAEALLTYIETNTVDVALINELIDDMAYRMDVDRHEIIEILNGQRADYSREDTEKYIKRRFANADIEATKRTGHVECDG